MHYDDETEARSRAYRKQYVESTPSWYRGEMHLAFTLLFTGGVMAYCIWKLDAPSWQEWLMALPIFLFGNYIEWAGHRYLLHRPTKLMKSVYKRHVGTHHQFFTHKSLDYNGHRDWRALLFPPFAPVMFVLTALPIALLVGYLWSANAGYIAMLTMAGYFIMYEGLHTLSHVENSPFLDNLPLVNSVRRMHVIHHNPEFMHSHNFNLTFPICDALFGTSDLNKGVIGTLFNGMTDEAMKPEYSDIVRRQRRQGGGK
jgi:hypothetical protein